MTTIFYPFSILCPQTNTLHFCYTLQPLNTLNDGQIQMHPALRDAASQPARIRSPISEDEGQWLTASEMFRLMNKRNASALRGISAKQLNYRLTAMGFKPKHTLYGNCYHVVQAQAA